MLTNVFGRVKINSSFRRYFTSISKVQDIALLSRPEPNSSVCAQTNLTVREHSTDDAILKPWQTITNLEEFQQSPHLLLRTKYLSVEPYMRCRFNADTGVDYVSPFEVGAPLTGSAVAEVLETNAAATTLGFKKGDFVCDPGFSYPFASHAIVEITKSEEQTPKSKGELEALQQPASETLANTQLVFSSSNLQKLNSRVPPTWALSICGIPGLTAFFGVTREAQARSGDICVVSSAAGAVGSTTAQLLKKLCGAYVIGLTSRDEKCKFIKEELECDYALNYKDPLFDQKLSSAVRSLGGEVDAYFDMVGGPITEKVIPLMDNNTKVILIGSISTYDTDEEYPPKLSAASQKIVDERNIVRERYTLLKYENDFNQGINVLCSLAMKGEIRVVEDLKKGIESWPQVFVGMMNGENIGKQIVEVL
eukprot:g3438.t1